MSDKEDGGLDQDTFEDQRKDKKKRKNYVNTSNLEEEIKKFFDELGKVTSLNAHLFKSKANTKTPDNVRDQNEEDIPKKFISDIQRRIAELVFKMIKQEQGKMYNFGEKKFDRFYPCIINPKFLSLGTTLQST